MGKVLVIDDDPEICDAIESAAMRMGHQVACSLTLADGLDKVGSESFDIVLLDVRLPDGDGLDALPTIQKVTPSPEVVIMTGFGTPDGAELAIKNGAWDYMEKPVSLKSIRLVLSRALQYQDEKKRRKGPTSLDRREIVGDSPALREQLDLLAQAAGSDINTLIAGETGTGKELFAWAIHNNSLRADKSFVVVDCTALPKTLVESVLFGHEKGAYTGADSANDGLIKQADGGTLFLDEVGELPLEIQKKFLRVLQERSFRPVGSERERKSDFRLIAATNKDLEELIEQGKFREDLLFRLRAMTIHLPSLRERPEDIKPLALHHISRLCERYRTDTKGFSPDFFEVLASYEWPGNVRELNQALESALASAGPNPMLFPKDLPAAIRAKMARRAVGDAESEGEPQETDTSSPYREETASQLPKLQEVRAVAIADAEQKYFKELLTHTSGNIKEACRISGLSRSRFYTLLKQHGIPPTYPMFKVDETAE